MELSFKIVLIFPLLFSISSGKTTSDSDFNVVIPEICSVGGENSSPVNISWIKEMVLLGIREDRPQLSLSITKPSGK
jgi:hypothetical protein